MTNHCEAETGELYRKAIEFRNKLNDCRPIVSTAHMSVRNRMAIALIELVFELFSGIILLLEDERHSGAALALLRPITEYKQRAFWVAHCPEDEECDALWEGRKQFPMLDIATKELEEVFKTGGADRFSISQKYRRVLNGLTHGGMEQIRFRGALQPAVPQELVRHILRDSAQTTAHSAILLALITEDPTFAEQASAVYNRLFSPD